MKAALLLVAAALASATPALADGVPPTGIWHNPAGTVRVRTGACGERLCGWVVWASDQAISDARDGGTDKLIGTALLQNYEHNGPMHWQGRVFVPDWNRTFFSRIEQLGPDQMKISGCILGGFLCKSQVWTRD